MQDDAAITPVISESSANFIEGLVKDAEAKNATFVTPYKREKNLIWPTLIDNVTADMRIAWEEPFGPVMPVIRVKKIQDAIDHCNSNNLALQVSIRRPPIPASSAADPVRPSGCGFVGSIEQCLVQEFQPLNVLSVLV